MRIDAETGKQVPDCEASTLCRLQINHTGPHIDRERNLWFYKEIEGGFMEAVTPEEWYAYHPS